jgi:hypothetical protein
MIGLLPGLASEEPTHARVWRKLGLRASTVAGEILPVSKKLQKTGDRCPLVRMNEHAGSLQVVKIRLGLDNGSYAAFRDNVTKPGTFCLQGRS